MNDKEAPAREHIVIVAGPTASGKTALSLKLAHARNGEIISVDSRQVYTMLTIGTEKISQAQMQEIPHHLIDIINPRETYSAGQFMADASGLITDILSRGKTPILAGGTNFYFDAILYGLPTSVANPELRKELESKSTPELMHMLHNSDSRRATRIDPHNRRRIVRALEIVAEHGSVPERLQQQPRYAVEWHILSPERDELRSRIRTRLVEAIEAGLVDEVVRVREYVGDNRLNELGLEYKIIGEYLRGERSEESLFPTLSSRLWHYARHQKAWLRKLDMVSGDIVSL